MSILIYPVSGGSFPSQLAGSQLLAHYSIEPDLMLGSSGGNLSAYIVHAADFKAFGIERVAKNLYPGLLISRWVPEPLPNEIVGFFQGSIYNNGSGTQEFFKTYFTPKSIVRREIWTGTYNRDVDRSTFFCNRSLEESVLGKLPWNYNLIQSTKPTYCDGDINLIADASDASASIPGFVAPKIVLDQRYVDGGIYFSSPLSALQSVIREKYSQKHLIYINSFNIDTVSNLGELNALGITKWAANGLIKGHIVSDRLTAYGLITNDTLKTEYKEGSLTLETLGEILEIRSKSHNSLIEIYPNNEYKIDISKFTGEEVVKQINLARKDLSYRFWWN